MFHRDKIRGRAQACFVSEKESWSFLRRSLPFSRKGPSEEGPVVLSACQRYPGGVDGSLKRVAMLTKRSETGHFLAHSGEEKATMLSGRLKFTVRRHKFNKDSLC